MKKTHGHTNPPSPTYTTWINMIQRCSNPKHPAYPRYGGRGITVCDRWASFENFLADMGVKPSDYPTLGREDNNGNYEPTNCRWENREQQANNKSNNKYFDHDGKSLTIPQWSRQLGVSVRALYYRLDRHGTIFIKGPVQCK
jgi:hypothetical protein